MAHAIVAATPAAGLHPTRTRNDVALPSRPTPRTGNIARGGTPLMKPSRSPRRWA